MSRSLFRRPPPFIWPILRKWVGSAVTVAPSMSIQVSTIPSNHPGNITLILTGSLTSWSGSTVFTLSGVTGVTKVGQNVTSATSASVTVATSTGTGTLTVTESVTGSTTATVTVANGTISISPTTGGAGSSQSITVTGGNKVWTQEVASTLFSVSGGVGPSISSVVVTGDNAATLTLTNGSGAATLTIRDESDATTTTFDVTLGTTTYDLTSSAVYNQYIRIEGGQTLTSHASVTSWGTSNVDGALHFYATATTIEVYCYNNGIIVRTSIDGVDSQVVTLPNTSAYGWVTIATGLDNSTAHEYLISGNANFITTQIRTTGTGVRTTYLPTRKPLVIYGDSITHGTSKTDGDSTTSWGHKAALSLGMQLVNLGAQSSLVSSGAISGINRASSVTALVPAGAVIVILYGRNDVNNSITLGTFTSSYLTMIQLLQTGCPAAKIICEAILKQSVGDTSADTFSSAISDDVAAIGWSNITYASGMYGSYDGSDGGLHPNAAACTAIAAACVTDVLAVLSGSSGSAGGGSIIGSSVVSGQKLMGA